MGGNHEYDILLNKYNILIAKSQDLQEQLLTKQKQWKKRDEDFSTMEKVVRELCEDILAKDPKEMVLGADYSWSTIPALELIIKARRVLRNYDENRKDFLSRILDQSEQRRQEIESLQDQISVMLTQPGSRNISQEELEKQIKKEKDEAKLASMLPMKAKTAIDAGKAKIVMDGYDNMDAMEEDLYGDIAEKNAKIQITPKSIPITENKQRLERKKAKKKDREMIHLINLKEYEEKINPTGWLLLEIIGTEGVSLYSDIEASLFEKDPEITTSKSRVSMQSLVNMGLANREPVLNPLKGKMYVYQLTDMGSRLFRDKFHKTPVSSEMDLIIAEHDNCVHGYGIKFVADILRETGNYKEVSDKNRKTPIPLGSGIGYIPDIICTDKNGTKVYIEYERGMHTQTDFNAKCNKMAKVTDLLNFIVPNQETISKIRAKVQKWIENRGAKSLGNITVRVTGASQIKDMDLSVNKNWKLVFKPGIKKEPFENF